MGWRVWTAQWILFHSRYSRLIWYIIRKNETITDKPQVQIYVNRIQNRVTFEIKSGHYIQFLTPKSMKLLWSTEEKITKDKNSENVPHLENIEVVLVH